MSEEFASADHNHEHNSLNDVLPDGPITTFHLDEETHGYLTGADGDPMSLQTDLTNIRNGTAIDPDAIINRHLAADSVEAAQIKNGAVTTDKIGDLQVTAAKLATDSVETAKIKNGNVTAAKLATDSVETAKIKDANVTAAKLSPTGGAEGKVLGFVAGTPNTVGWVEGGGGGGGMSPRVILSTPGADTWTVPAGVTKILVCCVGAGGSTVSPHVGGGGGGSAVKYYNVSPGDVFEYTVGAYVMSAAGGATIWDSGVGGTNLTAGGGGLGSGITGGSGGSAGEGGATGGNGGQTFGAHGGVDLTGAGGSGGHVEVIEDQPCGGGGAGGYGGAGGSRSQGGAAFGGGSGSYDSSGGHGGIVIWY